MNYSKDNAIIVLRGLQQQDDVESLGRHIEQAKAWMVDEGVPEEFKTTAKPLLDNALREFQNMSDGVSTKEVASRHAPKDGFDLEEIESMSEEAFIERYFSGKFPKSGDEQAWRNALDFMTSKSKPMRWKIFLICYMFHVSPKKFLLTGETLKSKRGDGVGIDPRLGRLLPHHTEEFITAIEDDKSKKGIKSRKEYNKRDGYFPDEFRHVNFSIVKKIAFLGLEFGDQSRGPIAAQIKVDGGRPSELTDSSPAFAKLDENGDTYRIKKETLDKMKNSSVFWNTDEFREVFSFQ
jgi:hypothetical protein